MAESAGIIIEALHIAKAVYDQAQKAKHLKSFSRNLAERAAIIEKILGNETLRKKIEQGNDAGLEQALQVILRTLREEVQPYVSALSEKGKIAKVKIFLQAGSYTEKYGNLTGTLDGALHTLSMALGIETTLTVGKIAEENQAIQQELEEVNLFLEDFAADAKKQGKSLSSLESYVKKLNKGIQELKSEKSIQITREFYYQSAISDIEKGVALIGKEKDDKRSVAEINELQKGVPEGQKSFIECAIANKSGGIAAVLPVENKEALAAVLKFLSAQQSGSGFQSDFFGKTKEKEEAKDEGGISCEKTEEGNFKVNISYAKLKLTPEKAKIIQNILKGDHGAGAYAHVGSSELDRRGNITWLSFDDEGAADNLTKELKASIAELNQQSPIRGVSPSPKT